MRHGDECHVCSLFFSSLVASANFQGVTFMALQVQHHHNLHTYVRFYGPYSRRDERDHVDRNEGQEGNISKLTVTSTPRRFERNVALHF